MVRILKCLDDLKVPGYTVIQNVTGKTPRSRVAEICLSQVWAMSMSCAAIEKITAWLNQFGGVCYVADAKPVGVIHAW